MLFGYMDPYGLKDLQEVPPRPPDLALGGHLGPRTTRVQSLGFSVAQGSF